MDSDRTRYGDAGNPIAAKVIRKMKQAVGGQLIDLKNVVASHVDGEEPQKQVATKRGACWLSSGTRRLRLRPKPGLGDIRTTDRLKRDDAVHRYRLPGGGSLPPQWTADESAHHLLLHLLGFL